MIRTATATIALFAAALAAPVSAQELRGEIAAQMPSLTAIYRDLHAHPELSGFEVRSAGILAAEARRLGYDVTENVGGHGVVAVMRNGPGPVVLLRADMDGLPVTEDTGLPFASTVRTTTPSGVESGVMHACGHDTHMTAWIGTARMMAAHKDRWSGTLVMIGQPAEESVGGARAMIADGLFTRFPRPQYALAFHDAAQFPAGQIGYTPGFALANVDTVDIIVHGVGGHGSMPQSTKDPIVLGARIVSTLQTLVSREVDPQDAAVVTVGSFHGGTRHNIIGNEARMQLTVRSYADSTRRLLLDGIARIARGEGIAAGLPDNLLPEVRIDREQAANATYNVPDFTEQMAGVLRTRFGAERITRMPPSMGAEDFSEFYRADNSIKSMIFWVGGVPRSEIAAAQAAGRTLPSLHSAQWRPDAEAVIGTATEAMATMAMDILRRPG